jgi:uncharacterized oxidoreductase
MNITGNTILITGGTSGIGLAFAERFFAEGNTVIICGRRADRLAAIAEKNEGMITRVCDIANAADRVALRDWVVQHYPTINVLINNAGVQYAADLTNEADMSKVYGEVETNLVAPIHLCSLFAAHFSTLSRASIINVSSGLAFTPLAFMPVYCATKAAIHSLTLSLRWQWRNTGVSVFEVAPPSVDTELGHDRRTDKSQSHGGIPVSEFLEEAMEGLNNDVPEIAVGQSKGLRAKREELFELINRPFEIK